MTFREKLADIISGGAITAARREGYNARNDEYYMSLQVEKHRLFIGRILRSTNTTTNGTGKMVARLGREALEVCE